MEDDLVISTIGGKVRGRIEMDYHGGFFYSFSGIPYAKAPIGELRFKAPQPAESWKEIWDGTKEGPECPSVVMTTSIQIGKEDNCLNLNVYTKKLPSINSNKILPVMVFIHGGSFFYGSNKSYLYGAHYLLTQEIVLVTINYRLGVFGFLSLNDSNLDVPGNAGLKDQVMAIKWVKSNICYFGGDANNVTIFGESAGSASVHYLLLSPLSKGLFNKAIMQSGCALNPWAIGRRNGADIAKLMGFNIDIDEKTLLQLLNKASTKSIIKAQFKIEDTFFASKVRPFGPVMEYPNNGAFLTEDPEKIMKSGKFHKVPVIIGYNSMEGLLYEVLRKTRTDVDLPQTLEKDIPFTLNIPEKSNIVKEMALELKQFYYKDEDISEKNINIRYILFGDVIFVHGIQKTIRLLKKHSSAPIYVYKMAIISNLNFIKKFCQADCHKIYTGLTLCIHFLKVLPLKNVLNSLREKLMVKKLDGAAHADDIFYLFKSVFTVNVAKGSEEDIYIQRFITLWTNFSKFGDPTPENLEVCNFERWKQIFDENIDNILEIGYTLRNIGNFEQQRIEFLENLYNKYGFYLNLKDK